MASMPSPQKRSSSGYSLIEIMIAVAIIALMTSMANISFLRMQRSVTARAGMRNIVALLNESRNNALILGAAAGTTRVQLAPLPTNPGVTSCPSGTAALPEFSDDGTTSRGRVAFVIDLTEPTCGTSCDIEANLIDPGMTITYISRIERVEDMTQPVDSLERFPYRIHCKTENVRARYRNNLSFVPENNITRIVIRYDSRGFVTGQPGPILSVQTRSERGTNPRTGELQRILINISGLACLEGSPDTVPQNRRCRSAGN